METLATQLRASVKTKTPYEIIAEKCNTKAVYVGQIARGERTPVRGKGLKVLNEIKKITNNE